MCCFYLGGDDIHLVNHVEDEVEDALLLEQVLPVPQGLQELLPVLVAGVVFTFTLYQCSFIRSDKSLLYVTS